MDQRQRKADGDGGKTHRRAAMGRSQHDEQEETRGQPRTLADKLLMNARDAINGAFGLRNLAAPGKYGDGNGLFLVVTATGAKRWVQRITIRGKRCDLGLGPLASVSLAEAREIAARNRKEARYCGDPLRDKREAAAILTFEEAAREVHRLHLPTWRNVKHGNDFIISLELYAFPRIGHIRVLEVSAADVLGVLTPIWTAKAETARCVRQRIGTVLKWAVAKGWPGRRRRPGRMSCAWR